MALRFFLNLSGKTKRIISSPILQNRGNILVYVVVTMVIFAVLGGAMVSLFSTSVTSSATSNDSRRAFYFAEAGLRYGISELRNNGFSTTVIATLNDTKYNMPPSGSFDINVFGAWFKSPSNQSLDSGSLNVEIDKGKIPSSFFEKTLPSVIDDLYLVVAGLDPRSETQKPNSAEISKVNGFSYTPGNVLSFTFDLADDFVVGRDKDICMAIKPLDSSFSLGNPSTYLDLKPSASNIFPKSDGSFLFDGRTYFYKNAKLEEGAYRLRGITEGPGAAGPSPVNVLGSSDYILLAPNNYFITSKGIFGEVSFGGDLDYSASLADHSYHSKPDIELDISKVGLVQDKTNFITGGTDPKGNDYLTIGGTSGPAIGAAWFTQSLFLGGSTNYCSIGKCFFESGIRVFFTLEYAGSGNGLIFALINGALNNLLVNNTLNLSIGGERDYPELLGYSGDGRLNSAGSLYIDNSSRGIFPPKIGLEFDTKVSFDPEFEKTVNYCLSTGALKDNTRNDPGDSNRDSIQYVFWGDDLLDISCRGNNSSYDDNRHDATGPQTADWIKPTGNSINTSPAMSPDYNTVYIGSGNNLIAYDASSGEIKWLFPAGGRIVTSPTVALLGPEIGTIYFGSNDGYLYALIDNGESYSTRWKYPTNTDGANYGVVNTKPAVGPGGSIYFASNRELSGFKVNYFFAIKPDKSQKWMAFPNPRGPNNSYAISPVVSPNGTYIYLATTSGTIFRINTDPLTGGGFSNFVSIPSDINFSPVSPSNENVFSPSIGDDGTIYVGANNLIYSITPSGISKSFTAGSSPLSSSPTPGPDGIVFVGSYDYSLYAVDTKELGRGWSFPTGLDINSQPSVDANSHIYFGSNDNHVYALYNDGRLKWKYSTGGDVRGRPEVRPNGTVYIGSFDYDFYAINQFANPKNLKNLRITSTTSSIISGYDETGKVIQQLNNLALGNEKDWLNGSTTKGPWAVRMEVERKLDDLDNYFEYNLRTWLRQCDDSSCKNIFGTFFNDTRVNYPINERPPLLEQKIRLSSDQHNDFNRFIFGFTSALSSTETQSATIKNFQLSFRRPNDPTAVKNPALDPDPYLP